MMRSTLLALIVIASGTVLFTNLSSSSRAQNVGALPVPASYSVPESAKESPTPKPGAPPETSQTQDASPKDTSTGGARRRSKPTPGACYVVVARTPLIGAFGNHIIDLYTKQPRYHDVGETLRSIVVPAERFQRASFAPQVKKRALDPANADRPLVQSPKDWGYAYVEKSAVQETDCAQVPPHNPEHRGPAPGAAGYLSDSAEVTVDDRGIIAF